MKIGTLNLQYGTGADGQRPSARILLDAASEIAEEKPDVLALQEVDNFNPRSAFEEQAEVLAEELEMNFHRVRTSFGSGLAILSPHPIESTHDFTLPKVTGAIRKTDSRFLGGWRVKPEQQRKVAYARIWIDGTEPIIFASTHFEARAETARRQLALALGGFLRVAGECATNEDPLILAGDFNLTPGVVSQVLTNLPQNLREISRENPAVTLPVGECPAFQSLASAPTYPANQPSAQIDHIVATGVAPGAASTRRFSVSDHLGLFVTV